MKVLAFVVTIVRIGANEEGGPQTIDKHMDRNEDAGAKNLGQ